MLKELQMQEFCQIFSLLEESFPLDEYRPREEQLALLSNSRYHVLGVSTEEGALKALLAVWEFDTILFVEHFAVAPAARNGGLGSAALQELLHSTEKTVCLEVELPEGELPRRRIGFYERNGFVFNAYPYMQPPISKGKQPVPLRIMTYGRAVDEAEFCSIRDTLYTHVYCVGQDNT